MKDTTYNKLQQHHTEYRMDTQISICELYNTRCNIAFGQQQEKQKVKEYTRKELSSLLLNNNQGD